MMRAASGDGGRSIAKDSEEVVGMDGQDVIAGFDDPQSASDTRRGTGCSRSRSSATNALGNEPAHELVVFIVRIATPESLPTDSFS